MTRDDAVLTLTPERLAQIQAHAARWFGRLSERGETELRGGSPWAGYTRDLLAEMTRLRGLESYAIRVRDERHAINAELGRLRQVEREAVFLLAKASEEWGWEDDDISHPFPAIAAAAAKAAQEVRHD